MAECIKQLEGIKSLMDPAKVVIAYEPVWAIGTGVTASPEQAQETHKAIRDWIAKEVSPSVAAGIRIQYGGSANAKNAGELSAQPDVDGEHQPRPRTLPCSLRGRELSSLLSSELTADRLPRCAQASSWAAPRSSPSSRRSSPPSRRPSRLLLALTGASGERAAARPASFLVGRSRE